MSNKVIHVFAGPNAIGKSTFGTQFSRSKGIPFINPEEISQNQYSLHKKEINFIELHHIMDINIISALEEFDEVIIESNLHEISSYRFIDSYVAKYKAKSICYYHYTDDINILKRRAIERDKHRGHHVPEEMLEYRYKNSFALIQERLQSFDEVNFLDNSNDSKGAKLILEVKDGKLNFIEPEISFEWTNKLIEKILLSES